jgi:Amt family ammonium transporter
MPLSANEHEQSLGMDIVQHGEDAYATGEGAILITQEGDIEPPVPVAEPA